MIIIGAFVGLIWAIVPIAVGQATQLVQNTIEWVNNGGAEKWFLSLQHQFPSIINQQNIDAVIQWLNKNVPDNAVIVEGYYDQDYSEFGRVSSFTGLQTIMGWLGHEYQWRMGWLAQSDTNYEEFNRRASDVNTIYTSNDPTQVLNTMKRYNAQYLYVGLLEEARYNKSNLRRFQSYMQIVYQSDNVTIYKVK